METACKCTDKACKCVELIAQPIGKIGFYVSYFGVMLVMLWIGIFKFTPTEAEAIRPLIENHPLMSWMYSIFSLQTVSSIVGSVEIVTVAVLLLGLWRRNMRFIGGLLVVGTFLFTLSFILTTPGTWKIVDGIPVTDFFILKDLVMLGFGGIIMASVKRK